jgi:hypothetical protein
MVVRLTVLVPQRHFQWVRPTFLSLGAALHRGSAVERGTTASLPRNFPGGGWGDSVRLQGPAPLPTARPPRSPSQRKQTPERVSGPSSPHRFVALPGNAARGAQRARRTAKARQATRADAASPARESEGAGGRTGARRGRRGERRGVARRAQPGSGAPEVRRPPAAHVRWGWGSPPRSAPNLLNS